MINKNDVDYIICLKGWGGGLTIEEINNLPREYDELKPSFKEWYYFMNHERPNPTKKETLKRKIHLVSTLTSLASPKEKPTLWDSFKNKIKRIVKWFVAIRIVKKL